jgi:transcriptional regulator with XRE-family HTH domain
MNTTIGNNIKKLRKHLKLSQTDFGRLVSLTHSAISQIEKGINTPLPKTIKAICIAYETSEEWLKTGKGPMFRDVGPEPHASYLQPSASHGYVQDADCDHVVKGITEEEYELLEKVLFVIRGKWQGKFEISLYQNIESFYSGSVAETGKEYTAKIDGKPPSMGAKREKH